MYKILGALNEPALMKKWIAQMALGIDALHKIGIIHGDIKPENVMLNDDVAMVTDFP